MIRRSVLAWAVGVGAIPTAAGAELLYGLTNLQELTTFDSVTRVVTQTTPLQGFSITGEILVSIDVRPATGQLFGLSNQSNLYIINPATGARTQVGTTLNPAVTGNVRAIDFNPTVDRIRVVTSGGQNLRVNPNDGAVTVDGALAFLGTDANAGDVPEVVSAGYTNSFAGATSTTLFDIEAGNNILARQAPPNDGTLNTVGAGLGLDVVSSGGFTGFDISGPSGLAYLTGNSLVAGGLTANSLYGVDLVSGQASLLGPVSGVNGTFRDIAVVPEPGGIFVMALAGGMPLLRRQRSGRRVH